MENEEMKDRIAHVIRAKGLTAAEFALKLGIQPSNISHVLSGRNNPSLDFVKKLKETFPEYNLDWIVFGTGPMTVSEPFVVKSPEMEMTGSNHQESKMPSNRIEEGLFANVVDTEMPVEPPSQPSKAKLKNIILVYDDQTCEVLLPR